MKLLTDENIATSVVQALRVVGHVVVDVKELGWQASSDQRIIDYALKHKCIVVTHDKDFLLQYRATVILLRFYNQTPSNVQKYLLHFLKNKSLLRSLKQKSLVIVTEYSFEIHKLG